MRVKTFTQDGETIYDGHVAQTTPYRAEIDFERKTDGQQYRIVILDAPDEFEVHIQYPNDQRECVWSLIQDPTVEEE